MQDETKFEETGSGKPRRKVYFMYSAGQRKMGSKIMRCDQLAAMANDHLGDRYEFEPYIVDRRPKRQIQMARQMDGAVVFLLNHALRRMEPKARAILKKKAAAVCVDYVDMRPFTDSADWYDIHMLACHDGFKIVDPFFEEHPEMLAPGARVGYVPHGGDYNLWKMLETSPPEPQKHDKLMLAYLGARQNAQCPKELQDRIHWLEYDAARSDACLKELSTYNMQFCVRNPVRNERSMPHPFTKGFNAALMGQNVLANRDCPDAEYYLGKDYPYFVKDNSLEEVRAGMDFAEKTFGGPEWQHGLACMAKMREMITPAAIAKALGDILDTVS